jgi:hypothetical protein
MIPCTILVEHTRSKIARHEMHEDGPAGEAYHIMVKKL